MSIKKKLVGFIVSAACAVSCIGITGTTSTVENTVEAASLTGQSARGITSQMVIGWNLGNSMDAVNTSLDVSASPKEFVTCWGNPAPTKELIDAVHAGGFNTVRMPTTWFQHLVYNQSTDTYEIDRTWMDYVKKTVDYAYNQGMFVILNVHHEDWVNQAVFTDKTLADASHKLKDIWTQVSAEFADYDQHLVFEGMNEPRQTGNPNVSEWGNGSEDNGYTYNYINTLNQIFINTVRGQGSSANSERLLMIPGYVATADTTALNNVNIPAGSGNVALSVHAYSPYFFAMATDEYANHEFPGKSGWGEDYESSLQSLFSSLKSVSDQKNVPIIIGEFSASDFNNTESRVNWAKSYLSKAKEAGIPCVLWDNNVTYNGSGEAHGYINWKAKTWYPNSQPVIAAMMDTVGVSNYSLPVYTPATFSWDKLGIESDWVELYRSENGKEVAAWKNFTVPGWKDYVNENYKLVMFYEGVEAPTVIFQGSAADSWNTVKSNDELEADFTAGFLYEDMVSAVEAKGEQLSQMNNLFISAGSKDVVIRGLYAVPLSSQPVIDFISGDVNGDKIINVYDAVMLRQFIVSRIGMDGLPAPHASASDVNGDGSVGVADLVLLQKYLVGYDVQFSVYNG